MLAKLMGWLLLAVIRVLTGAQARWYGCPPKAEQRIYFANHQSHADLVMIWAALPEELRAITRPIAARDYWTQSNFKRWITTAVFNIPLNNHVDGLGDPASIANPAKEWSDFYGPWMLWHNIRTAGHTFAFGLLSWALILVCRKTT